MYYVELNVTQKPDSYTHRLPDVTNANDFGKPYTVKYELWCKLGSVTG